MAFQSTRRTRHALTIIEVMIAIGVILIGLLGIAALIPVAAEDASASVRIDSGIRMAASVTADLRARNVGALENLFYWDNDPRNDDGRGANTASSERHALTERAELDAPSFELATGRSTTSDRRFAPFCIDPKFLSVGPTALLPTDRNAYQLSRFPYYNEFYSGIAPPNETLTGIGTGFPLPRMWRVAYGLPDSASPPRPFFPPGVADFLVRGEHKLVLEQSGDDLAPLGQRVNPLTGGVTGSRQYESNYSWIATVEPPRNGDLYKLSVVVIEDRPRSSGITGAAAFTVTDAEDNLPAERVAFIGSGVSLGSTTEVEIYASDMVSSKLKAGEWVMLSNQPFWTNTTTGVFEPHHTTPAVHRWFRVVSVGPVETGEFGVPVLGTVDNVWRRRVALDGPSWSFLGDGADGTVRNNTYMTIVEGAVAVIESDIRIP